MEAIFNQLLWDIGVSQAQIHEIYTLDLESFESIKYCSLQSVLIKTRSWTNIPLQVEERAK